MKSKTLPSFLLSAIIFFISFLPANVFAGTGGLDPAPYAGDPACDPSCNCRPDKSICPIDSYVYVLIGIGVLYGIKKVKDSRNPAVE